MHDYYDEFGQSRTYSGGVNSPSPAMGNPGEQAAAGVGHLDSPNSAQAKVAAMRRARGLDPYTGLTKEGAAAYWSHSGPSPVRILAWAALLVLALAALASPAVWEKGLVARAAAASAIEAWGLERAIDGEEYAPFSAYGKYLPKSGPSEASPAEINAKAQSLFVGELLDGRGPELTVIDRTLQAAEGGGDAEAETGGAGADGADGDRADAGADSIAEALAAAVGEPVLAQLDAAAILVLAIGAGQQVAQLVVAIACAAQQQQTPRLVAIGVVADPHVAADDGLDALAARGLVELHQREHIGQIGQRQRRHAVLLRLLDGIAHAHDAVDYGKLGVEAEMDESGVGHGV